jgi:hypothetical protein
MAMVRYSNDFWVKHVSACAASGLRSKAYAEQHGLSLKSFYNWQSKLRVRANRGVVNKAVKAVRKQSSQGQQFLAVRIKPEAPSEFRLPVADFVPTALCTLTMSSGVKLEMAKLPDPQWLAMLSNALTQLPTQLPTQSKLAEPR